MAALFPTQLPAAKTNWNASATLAAEGHTTLGHIKLAEELNALAAKVGINSSAVTTSHDYLLRNIPTQESSAEFDVTGFAQLLIKGSGNGSSFAELALKSNEATDKSWFLTHQDTGNEINALWFTYTANDSNYYHPLVLEPSAFNDALTIEADGDVVIGGAFDLNGKTMYISGDREAYLDSTDTGLGTSEFTFHTGGGEYTFSSTFLGISAGEWLQTDEIKETTTANGVTIDGLLVKDSKLATNNSVVTANVTDGAVTPVKISNPYRFRVYRAAAHNMGPAAILPFDTEVYDTNNNFDVATNVGRYTVPVSGVYLFTARVSTTEDVSRVITELRIDGVAYARGLDLGIDTDINEHCSILADVVPLTAGQYVEVYAVCEETVAIVATQLENYFSGILLQQT